MSSQDKVTAKSAAAALKCSRDSLIKAVRSGELQGEIRGNVLYVNLAAARKWWKRPRKRAGRKAKVK